MDETINILCATDNKYAPYCGIMLTSLFENNRGCRFNVYLFVSCDVSQANKKKFSKLGNEFSHAIELIKIDDSMVEMFPLNESMHISRPTYYRLLVADLLPQNIHKVIYLDCDIIVCGDIKPLWEQIVEGKALAGVRDPSDYQAQHWERLGASVPFEYFNAGVLVCNMDNWRQSQLLHRVRSYISDNFSRLMLMDQDALNGLLLGEYERIPLRYNCQLVLFKEYNWNHYPVEIQKTYLEEVWNAVVIHYSDFEKPWNIRSYGGPFYSLWHKYRRMSLWRTCIETKPIMKIVRHLVKRHIFPRIFRKQRQDWVVIPENEMYYR